MAAAGKTDAKAHPGQPDYGQDAPFAVRRMFTRGAWTLAGGVALWYINHQQYPGPAASLFGVLAAIAAAFCAGGAFLIWSSRAGKLQMRDRLLDSLALRGDEKVLDAGCGRGLMAIGAARRLKTGKVTGVDIWDAQALAGNSGDAARANAKLEGVAERVRIENGDVRKLIFPENHFDVVLSSGVVHTMADEPDRDQAVREMYRVLKPGGHLLIFDSWHTSRYAQVLRERGAADVTFSPWSFLWCAPNRSLTARK